MTIKNVIFIIIYIKVINKNKILTIESLIWRYFCYRLPKLIFILISSYKRYKKSASTLKSPLSCKITYQGTSKFI